MSQANIERRGAVRSFHELARASLRSGVAAVLVASGLLGMLPAAAVTNLADAPVFSTNAVLGNVALALSVEYPTAIRAAYPGTNDYSSANTYQGYFDPNKCYLYQFTTSSSNANSYFYPNGQASSRTCSGKWSGNFLNWAATQTIDPFRWVMTGGYRVTDTNSLTVLQKAWSSGQDNNLFPNKSLSSGGTIAGATPFNKSSFNVRVAAAGFDMLFTVSGTLGTGNPAPTGTDFNPANALVDATVYRIPIRVKVCDPSASAGGLETNCKQYGANYKPEGLMQQYANRLRFAALGYLNQSGNDRDGAVLRARMKFVGPTYPVPGAPPATNVNAEWDPATGIFLTNPDSADATATNTFYAPATAVSNSGVANYLNKFGQLSPGSYKGNDPVGELYYATQRYYRNLGSVPEWNTLTNTTTVAQALDGFPVVRTWDDPIQYSCQKNFILGIGDIYTHADKHVPGTTNNTSEVVAKPASISGDTAVDAVAATDIVGTKQGLGAGFGSVTGNTDGGCCSANSTTMAGLAYWANVNDIRPDNALVPKTLGKQTIQTLWVDVLERPFFRNNTYYLTAKYGGFIVPNGVTYNYNDLTALPDAWWTTNNETVTDTRTTPATVQKRPDNYFTAGSPDQMITGLTKAFQRINTLSAAFTTSFSTSLPQVSALGTASFGAQYDPSNWTGEVVASELTFAADGTPSLAERWRASATLATQLGGTGWNTGRRVATWNGTAGIPFRHASLTAAQRTALDTSYRLAVDDSADFLNYLRGDRTHEENSTVTGSSRAYRKRDRLLGDIVGSRALPVGAPALPMSDASNPGYGTFKDTYKNRTTVLYVGSNEGMLHAFNGSLTGATAGQEIMAYVPAATFNGPSAPATPEVNGLASLGNPSFSHRYFVNATPMTFDVDFTRTWNGTTIGAGAADWRTILVGGMGKGGRSYYALDITDPSTVTTEAVAASKVLWEFTAPQMGFTFGEAVVAKTRKYGWTVILPSGYNTPDGRGYIFFVHPQTGALLETVTTGEGSVANDAGLAHINGYVLNYEDGYLDAVYGGDLQGNLWRVDVTPTSGAYAAPQKIATLTDSAGVPQPVTTRPLVELHPKTRERVVLVGTGRLLDTTDINSTQEQTFYAIKDGNQVRFNRSTDLPSGVTFPITRSQLIAQTDLLTGITPTATAQMGWYVDLGRGAGNVGWRVVTDPSPFFGLVAFAPTLPSIADACAPSGSSRVYTVDFATGKTVLKDVNGAYTTFLTPAQGVITDLRFLSVSGKPRLIAGTDRGEVVKIDFETGSLLGLQRLNWREISVGN